MKTWKSVVAAGSALAFGVASAQQTVRASLDSSGAESNGHCESSVLSADGRFVAFESLGSTLVAGDTSWFLDVFVRDRASGTTVRVSVDSSGAQADDDSSKPAISADGKFVAFQSRATNLVAGDTNQRSDVFVHDLGTGLTERVSVDSSGGAANQNSSDAALSADGGIVAFTSRATNLVPGDGNGSDDAFVHDRATGITERVSVDSAGAEGDARSYLPSLSADGRWVAFCSDATNLVAGDTNAFADVFVHDRTTGVTERVNVDSSGAQSDSWSTGAAISADGNVVAFTSDSDVLVPVDTNHHVDIFVHDRTTGITERVSVDSAGGEGDGDSGMLAGIATALSADGGIVAFDSVARNLVAHDTNGARDVFVRDRVRGITERVDVDTAGAEGDHDSLLGSMAPDGSCVVFDSLATNLVSDDLNFVQDVFVRDRALAAWTNYGAGLAGTNGVPAITPDQDPGLGATITVTVDNSRGQPTAGFLVLGFQRAQIPTHLGGDLLVVPALIVPITFSFGADSFTGALPDDPAFAGFVLDLQAVEVDPGAPKGVAFTAGLELVLGS